MTANGSKNIHGIAILHRKRLPCVKVIIQIHTKTNESSTSICNLLQNQMFKTYTTHILNAK